MVSNIDTTVVRLQKGTEVQYSSTDKRKPRKYTLACSIEFRTSPRMVIS